MLLVSDWCIFSIGVYISQSRSALIEYDGKLTHQISAVAMSVREMSPSSVEQKFSNCVRWANRIFLVENALMHRFSCGTGSSCDRTVAEHSRENGAQS